MEVIFSKLGLSWYYIAAFTDSVSPVKFRLKCMAKISKLADYATVIMACLASQEGERLSAAAVAKITHLKLPTVTKVLKILHEAQLLHSTRGQQGGYALTKSPEKISLAEIIAVVDGESSITECGQGKDICHHEKACRVKANWRYINNIFNNLLRQISLADMGKTMHEQPMTFWQSKTKKCN